MSTVESPVEGSVIDVDNVCLIAQLWSGFKFI